MGLWKDFVKWLSNEEERPAETVIRRSVVHQEGNIVGGDMAGGSIHRDDNPFRVRGTSIRSGSSTIYNVTCKGNLCLTNGNLSIDGVRFGLKEHEGSAPVFFVNDEAYVPWDVALPPHKPTGNLPPWSGKFNGHQIVVKEDGKITVDGVSYLRE